MSKHFQLHRAVRTTRGGRHIPNQHIFDCGEPIYTEVYCQRFFATGPQCSYFEVASPPKDDEVSAGQRKEGKEQRQSGKVLSKEALLHDLVNAELEDNQRLLEAKQDICQAGTIATEVDPWLDSTRWRQLFNGVPLLEAAQLGYMPTTIRESDLHVLTESVDRLVEQAYVAVCDDTIGVFDQYRINSFVSDDSRRAGERALMVKLRKESYRAYKYVWKRLLCFVCRTSAHDGHSGMIRLPHRYTALQLQCIYEAQDAAKKVSQACLDSPVKESPPPSDTSASPSSRPKA